MAIECPQLKWWGYWNLESAEKVPEPVELKIKNRLKSEIMVHLYGITKKKAVFFEDSFFMY